MSDTNIAAARGIVLSFYIDADNVPISLLPPLPRGSYFLPPVSCAEETRAIKYTYHPPTRTRHLFSSPRALYADKLSDDRDERNPRTRHELSKNRFQPN